LTFLSGNFLLFTLTRSPRSYQLNNIHRVRPKEGKTPEGHRVSAWSSHSPGLGELPGFFVVRVEIGRHVAAEGSESPCQSSYRTQTRVRSVTPCGSMGTS